MATDGRGRQDQWVLPVRSGELGLRVQRGRPGRQVLVRQGLAGQRAVRVVMVQRGRLEWVPQDPLALQVRQEMQVQQVEAVLLVPQDLRVSARRGLRDQQAQSDRLDRRGLREALVLADRPVHKGRRDPRAVPVQVARQGPEAPRGLWGHRELVGQRGRPARLGRRVRLARRALLVPQDHLGRGRRVLPALRI